MRIDSHQHFWKFDPKTYSWIDERMEVIQRDFMPADLEPLLQKHGIDGTVAVQAVATEEDTDFLLALSRQHEWIKKVVGWVDLRAEDLEEKLEKWQGEEKLAGFRHISQSEPPERLYDPLLKRGIELLRAKGYTYDVLVFPQHLKGVYDLVQAFPEQKFVLDHLAKPHIKDGDWREWARDINRLSAFPNFYCKVSGMVTEADWQHWKQDDLLPYLDVVFEAFGTSRLMYGSDWPVALVAASYDEVLEIVKQYISKLSEPEQAQVMGGTACEFYGIN